MVWTLTIRMCIDKACRRLESFVRNDGCERWIMGTNLSDAVTVTLAVRGYIPKAIRLSEATATNCFNARFHRELEGVRFVIAV